MRVRATAKYTRHSTRKARLVTQAIVGRRVVDASAMLRFMPQLAAKDVAKVLKSAAANAENNHDLSPEDLVVVEAIANEGPTLKRFRERAQGRAFPIHKPMTHITVVVEDREAPAPAPRTGRSRTSTTPTPTPTTPRRPRGSGTPSS